MSLTYNAYGQYRRHNEGSIFIQVREVLFITNVFMMKYMFFSSAITVFMHHKTLKLQLLQSLLHIINKRTQDICLRSHLRTKSMTKSLHFPKTTAPAQSIAHKVKVKILKEKYKKISVLLQQLTYEINDKIYFLQEPKKSASAVALLQNQV